MSDPEKKALKVDSKWVVMARRPEYLGGLMVDPRWTRLSGRPGAGVWTDDYSNIIGALVWGIPAD